jgi:glutamine cyclotransferase
MTLFQKCIFLFLAIGMVLLGCREEKKSEDQAPEMEMVASLPKVRFVIGDSISVGFIKPMEKAEIWLGGKVVGSFQAPSDSINISTRFLTTGWHKIVVKGVTKDSVNFSDTLRVELLSDIVPAEIKYTVIGSFPHQKSSFTQGLEFYKGELFEGTGQTGMSKLMKNDLNTGAVLKSIDLEDKYFGEGITIVNDKIYQLTWQSGVCFRYNMDFQLDQTYTYYTQGWGLTHDDQTLIMSDGSSKLYFYNTEMEKTGEVDVYDHAGPVRNLNELEYVDGYVFANIFQSTKIVKIDPRSGKVVGFMSMDGITPPGTDVSKDVLNGIARLGSEDALYVTGKNWPLLFKIRLIGVSKNKLVTK